MVNFIAIEFAAASIFMWFGLVELPHAADGSLVKAVTERLGISFLILIVATTFMTQTLITIVGEKKLANDIRTVLNSQLDTYAGARLSDIKFDRENSGLQVMATVITPQEFDPARVATLEKALQVSVNPNTQLIVRSLLSKDSDGNGPVFISAAEIKLRTQVNQENDYMNKVSLVLSEQIKTINGAQVIDVVKDTKDGMPVITATVRTPLAIAPTEVQSIQQQLNDEVDGTIKLVVRSILTKDADAQQFLNHISNLNATLQGEDLILYENLFNEITWYLNQEIAGGVTITELNFKQIDQAVNVYVSVNTPVTVEPALVAKLQWNVQTYIDSRINVTVRSVVGGTATADAYIAPLE